MFSGWTCAKGYMQQRGWNNHSVSTNEPARTEQHAISTRPEFDLRSGNLKFGRSERSALIRPTFFCGVVAFEVNTCAMHDMECPRWSAPIVDLVLV